MLCLIGAPIVRASTYNRSQRMNWSFFFFFVSDNVRYTDRQYCSKYFFVCCYLLSTIYAVHFNNSSNFFSTQNQEILAYRLHFGSHKKCSLWIKIQSCFFFTEKSPMQKHEFYWKIAFEKSLIKKIVRLITQKTVDGTRISMQP